MNIVVARLLPNSIIEYLDVEPTCNYYSEFGKELLTFVQNNQQVTALFNCGVQKFKSIKDVLKQENISAPKIVHSIQELQSLKQKEYVYLWIPKELFSILNQLIVTIDMSKPACMEFLNEGTLNGGVWTCTPLTEIQWLFAEPVITIYTFLRKIKATVFLKTYNIDEKIFYNICIKNICLADMLRNANLYLESIDIKLVESWKTFIENTFIQRG